MSLLSNYLKYSLNTRLKPTISTKTDIYSITYTSGLQEYVEQYNIWYLSHYLSDFTTTYTLVYTSKYGDSALQFRVRYTSGVELTDRLSRYTFKYTSVFTNLYNTNYTLRYSTLSPTESSFRRIYKLRYSSEGSKENTTQFTVRYSLEFFKNRSLTYHIKYDSHTPFTYNTQAVLLRNNKTTGVLFCIRGRQEVLTDNIYVFSNLPRYQLISMEAYENKTNIVWLEVEDIKPYNLFLENSDERNSIPPVAYILVKDINEINNMSLDIYNSENLDKINKSKSFFFDLDSNAFIINPVTVDGEAYTYSNFTSEYYNYTYLNFVERSLTPLFRLGDNCCFNTKINSTTTGGMCSPF